ncbi:MAG TPA: ATP-binding cassette domain-containing protein [Solirubrobacteraceae bacterium]|nr:ATP-binding cassette domain-containing protein [Solirubrobacteraceae bacterium]
MDSRVAVAAQVAEAPQASVDQTGQSEASVALAIESRDLCKRFGGHRVLDRVDLRIPEGVICALMGPSGTGKSVLIKHVLGLLKPDSGEVLVRGKSLNRMTHAEVIAMRRDIGVMFQDGALFSSMTVFENVAFPLRQHTNYTDREVREIVMDHLTKVGLAHAVDRYPAELSGGMKKRAGLARGLALDPGIVLADEPDSGLDPVRTALLGELLKERHAELGGTVVVITHNVMLAKRVADHVSVLWRGKVVAAGRSEEMWSSEDPFIRQFLSGASGGPLGMD